MINIYKQKIGARKWNKKSKDEGSKNILKISKILLKIPLSGSHNTKI